MTIDQLIEKLAPYPGNWEVVVDQSVGLYCPSYNELTPKNIVRGEFTKTYLDGGKFVDRDLGNHAYGNVNSVCIGYRPECAYNK